jgi:hypothetical protein
MTLIWTTLPAGVRRNAAGDRIARVSVFLTPRLDAPARGAPLSAFPAFVDWPGTLASLSPSGIEFMLQVRGAERIVAGPTVAPSATAPAADSTAWRAIFPPSTQVLPFDGPARTLMGAPRAETYDAAGVVAAIHGAYAAQLASELSSELRPPSLKALAVEPPRPNEPLSANAPPLAQFANFYRPRSPSPNDDTDRKAAPGGTDEGERCADFHAAVAGVGTHPQLLRKLGLVLDLDIAVDALGLAPRAPGLQIRVVPRNAGIDGARHVCHWTAVEYATAEGGDFRVFRAAAETGRERLAGFHDLNGEIATITEMNVEHAAFGLLQAAGSATDEPLPALLQGGMRLFDATLPSTVRSAIAAQAELESMLAGSPRDTGVLGAAGDDAGDNTDAVTTLYAEHVTRGYRIDVRDVDSGPWRSLCRRHSRYSTDGWQWPAESGAPVEDEGIVEPIAYEDPEADAQALRVPPELFTWDGWSLAVARPDDGADAGASAFAACDADGGDTTPLDVQSGVPAGSLQPQRFGRCYQFRARTVDLAGNSLTVEEADAIAPRLPAARIASPPVCCLRVESAKAPVVVRGQPRGPGEAGDIIVLRDAEHAAHRTTEVRLHVLPPEVSVRLAEQHGVFDGMSGADSWRLIRTHRGDLHRDDDGNEREYIPGEEIYSPYLPDPMVRQGVMILPGGAGSIELPRFDDVGAAARGRELARSVQLVVKAGRNELRTGVRGRRVTLSVPKGRSHTIRLAAALGEAQLAVAAFAQPERRDPVSSPDVASRLAAAAARGDAPTLAPPREIRIVHATQRPLTGPVFGDPEILPRSRGDSGAVLADERLLFDRPSTGRIDVYASWADPVDDPADPGWRVERGELHAGGARIGDEGGPPFGDDPAAASRRPPLAHDFGDTKHHEVTYRAVAASRFVEFYPASLTSDPASTTRTSSPVTLHVPATAPPAAPDIACVLPTFRHDRTPPAADELTITQSGNGLRVYLERGWFSSGADERLAVVVATPGTPDALRALTSAWGVNPIHDTAPLPGPLALGHLISGTDKIEAWPHADGGIGLAVHAVDFSDAHGQPFADIEFAAPRAFMPLVRLALARFQPHAIDGCHLSRIVLADFVPLAPGRALTVKPAGRAAWSLDMRGDSYRRPATERDRFGTSVVRARIEFMTSSIQEEIAAWRPLGEPVTLQASPIDTWRYRWSGTIAISDPQYRSTRWRHRLVIEEFEPFDNAGGADVPLADRARLVSAQTLRL